jgi:hypothetical protein
MLEKSVFTEGVYFSKFIEKYLVLKLNEDGA